MEITILTPQVTQASNSIGNAASQWCVVAYIQYAIKTVTETTFSYNCSHVLAHGGED
jgi:hypothetical protein